MEVMCKPGSGAVSRATSERWAPRVPQDDSLGRGRLEQHGEHSGAVALCVLYCQWVFSHL